MVKYYSFDTWIGSIYLYFDESGILGLYFGENSDRKNFENHYKKAVKVDIKDYNYHSEILKYLGGELKTFDLPFTLKGSSFQMKVWNALLNIGYGELKTYKDIAIEIGSPKAYRAVGGALNKNPISIIVPCHRIIGSGGALVGFGGGLDVKEKLLQLEKRNKNSF